MSRWFGAGQKLNNCSNIAQPILLCYSIDGCIWHIAIHLAYEVLNFGLRYRIAVKPGARSVKRSTLSPNG